ncbi:WXG100 family type VII secretion target [Nocardia callitridis]|uniref:ESAT-6-like protein n=1 Tax=Nocardia callitridis TaxID=648753 RepID=A0ABP9L1E4_9NOCA
MADVYADHVGADQAKGDMANAVEGMRFTLKAITDEVHAAKGWSGDARTAFMAASASWDEEAQKLNALLDRITEQVGAGTAQFKRTDAEGEDEFNYIRI